MKRVVWSLALVLGLMAAVVPVSTAGAAAEYAKFTIDDSLGGANHVFVYDIDGDGCRDVVAAGYTAGEVVWYEAPEDATQSWLKHTIDNSLGGAYAVFVYDINKDNHPDVAATGEIDNTVVWYEAPDDPTQPWTKRIIDAGLTGARDVFVYDVNGDGRLDVVASAYDSGNAASSDVVWYQNLGGNPFSWSAAHAIDAALSGARDVFVYDIDRDSNPDVAATGQLDDDVVWYEADDNPTLPWVKHTLDADLGGAWGIYVEDVDVDGNSDIVASGQDADALVWYQGPDDPLTGAWIKRTIDDNLDGARSIYMEDIDFDTFLDVVVAGYAVDDVLWYRAPADPILEWGKVVVGSGLDGPTSVFAVDMDGDTVPDVCAAGYDAGEIVWYQDTANAPWSCFIATAAYDTALDEDLDVLRSFRDRALMSNPLGNAFVEIYYRTSPPIANALSGNPTLRAATRATLIAPLLYGAKMISNVVALGVGTTCLALLLFWAGRRRLLKALGLGMVTMAVLASAVLLLGYLGYYAPLCAEIAAYLLPLILPLSAAVMLFEVRRTLRQQAICTEKSA